MYCCSNIILVHFTTINNHVNGTIVHGAQTKLDNLNTKINQGLIKLNGSMNLLEQSQVVLTIKLWYRIFLWVILG